MRKLLLLCALILLASAGFAQNMNFTWTNGAARKSCADLQVTSDEYAIARNEQVLNIADSSSLEITEGKNGGVYVYGSDQPGYQINACKIGFGESEAEAQQVLAGLNIGRNGSTVTANGPEGKHWSVHYIVRVPKDADFKAETYNGPVSARDTQGRISLRSHNGPVTFRRCVGEVRGETQNGPVSFTGTTGNVSLSTQNGPVSLKLESPEWNGDITASTHNGPVSLQVPENFQSAFLVEGGRGPMSCDSTICSKANQVREEGRRRIEFGNSPHVKASTENGPVSISALRGDI